MKKGRRVALLSAVLLVGSVAACSSSGGSDATPIANPVPLVPQLAFRGGAVIANPRLTVVTFPGEPLASGLEAFAEKLGPSSYWSATTAEYGVGPAVATSPVRLDEAPPPELASLDDLRRWLGTKLEAGDPRFGTADESSLYVLVLPVNNSETICPSAGVHDSVTLSNGRRVSFAVLTRCVGWLDRFFGKTPLLTDELGAATVALSHELVEAATDPFLGVNGDAAAWNGLHDRFQFQGEVADLCFPQSEDPNFIFTAGDSFEDETFMLARTDSFLEPADLPFTVTRSWSNRAALAGTDPCVPHVAGQAYAAARAVLPDMIKLGSGVVTPGVAVANGTERTIDVKIIADNAKTWKLQARDGSAAGGHVSLDRDEAVNGDTVHLTLRGAPLLGGGLGFVYLLASDESHTTISYVYVSQ